LKNYSSRLGKITSPLRSGLRFSSKTFLFLALPVFSGCSSVGYLLQAGKGQLTLLNRAKPISEVLKDERTPPKIKAILSEVDDIKKFGESQLLKATKNYRDYVKVEGGAISWVVSACDPLKFEPRRWSFPIVGSFTYLGWFSLDDTKEYAEEIKKEGLDVDVRGAAAYSTLGWFRDPVLSTMVSRGDESLGDFVNIILHESVHATYYLDEQSSFNESLASFVADQMTPQYLEQKKGKASPELASYLAEEKQSAQRQKLFHQAYNELDELYKSSAPREEKLAKKADVLQRLMKATEAKREVNNATLIQFRTYGSGLAEFEKVYAACGRDWNRFWKAIRSVNDKSFPSAQMEEIGPVVLKAADACALGS
jgi:predicted aminopeptidase